jgi:hypothetical protein
MVSVDSIPLSTLFILESAPLSAQDPAYTGGNHAEGNLGKRNVP